MNKSKLLKDLPRRISRSKQKRMKLRRQSKTKKMKSLLNKKRKK
jgi:hypothetical protein